MTALFNHDWGTDIFPVSVANVNTDEVSDFTA